MTQSLSHKLSIDLQKKSIDDIQRRKSVHVTYRDLVSWVAGNQDLDLRIMFLKKFSIFFALFFDENNIVKLGIAATDG